MFKPPKISELYVNEFPICWRVIQLPASGRASAAVIFLPDAAFFVPQIDEHGNVSTSILQPCPIGYRTTLVGEPGSLMFTPPMPGREGFLECANQTWSIASFGVGSLNGPDLSPTVIWKNILSHMFLRVQPTSELLIYATSQYKSSEIITGPIQAPLLWDQNLEFLTDVTNLTVSVDPHDGKISITQVLNEESII